MKELLDSDRVNFLIWRQYVQSQVPRDVPATAEATQHGVFGPLIAQPPHKEEDFEDEPELVEETEISSRKRQVDRQLNIANGSPAKRQRLSNGYENGAETATTPMEIDPQNQLADNHAYPSPLEGEQATTPITRTDGPEQGTQIDKVDELAPETIFLRLGADESSVSSSSAANAATAAATVAGAGEASPSRASQNPIVLHCEWNPREPSLLAAAGSDALARVWTVSRATAQELVADHVNGVSRPFNDLTDHDMPKDSTVTAMAWNVDGTAIALATQSDNKAHLNVWDADGTHMQRFDIAEPPVIKLRWNPNNDSILGIAPDKKGTVITIFAAEIANTVSYCLLDHDLTSDPLDASWLSASEFVLCGGDLLLSLRYAEGSIVPQRKFDTGPDARLSHVQFDDRSRLVATASEKGIIDLWNEAGVHRSISAHLGPITSFVWQPLQAEARQDERLLASGGEDGAIVIWNVLAPDNKPKCSMTMELPIVALAFTPDGAFIAGATTDRILIWKVGEHAIPRASWSRAPHPGWLSPRMNGDVEEEDTHCLCWDATGQKLAYGANSRLAVINFR
ncbi:putative wd repeat protein [Phaeoacremonium minimum UCRPA7]|uniref:Putative wd repeat protein n=1 Tax=Phaeoacremonium minimum (strain UCR-PA7) TaxID=1286976 RepID=R8BY87_PHAM7|nr:putative wd repeat protein [Phaeoacremonium minimum UCRPA7]EOO04300.1 putative wd repeat protein [Phaeoacremonium minimum UCRPA7]